MHRIFQTFIDRLLSAENATTFAEAMASIASALDLSYFAYLALPTRASKTPLVISTYPARWVAHYVRNHYESHDPVIMQALQSPELFRWGSDLSGARISAAQRELLNEASQFGIRSGFTVPIHDGRGPIAALTFAADQPRTQFENCISSHGRLLQLIAMCFHAHVRRNLAGHRKIGDAPLSPREFECLKWAAQGKSAWEIGCILGISHHTVASYLGNAKEKLGVRTIVQAAARFSAATI